MVSVADGQDPKQNDAASWFPRDVLSWHRGMSVNDRQTTLGEGATAPPAYMRRQARALFLGALYRLAPHLSDDLLRPELDRLTDRAFQARLRWIEQTNVLSGNMLDFEAWQLAKGDSFYVDVVRENEALETYFRQWQARHNLNDEWLYGVAYATARLADALPGSRGVTSDQARLGLDSLPLILGDNDLLYGPHTDKLTSDMSDSEPAPGAFRFTPECEQIDIPVFLDHLKHPDMVLDDGALEDEGDFGAFDPRTETVVAAAHRLMPELEKRLRRALERIAGDDRILNGAQPTVTLRKMTAFEWLVRYQVLGESMRSIARADYKDVSNISREIHRAASLIGLTLRSSTGGRPRRTHAHTIKLLR